MEKRQRELIQNYWLKKKLYLQMKDKTSSVINHLLRLSSNSTLSTHNALGPCHWHFASRQHPPPHEDQKCNSEEVPVDETSSINGAMFEMMDVYKLLIHHSIFHSFFFKCSIKHMLESFVLSQKNK